MIIIITIKIKIVIVKLLFINSFEGITRFPARDGGGDWSSRKYSCVAHK